MAKLRHLAISCPDPWQAAEFYTSVFGMTKVGETDSSIARGVYLSDGIINLALLNYKDEHAAGGPKPLGINHIGFWVDDVESTVKAVEEAGGKYFLGEVPVKSNIFYEVKVRDPNGVIIDVTHNGWGGASKDGVTPGPTLRHPDERAER